MKKYIMYRIFLLNICMYSCLFTLSAQTYCKNAVLSKDMIETDSLTNNKELMEKVFYWEVIPNDRTTSLLTKLNKDYFNLAITRSKKLPTENRLRTDKICKLIVVYIDVYSCEIVPLAKVNYYDQYK